MKKSFTTTGIVLLVLFTLAPRGAPAAGPEASDYRKYAPSRGMDILHFALDVTPDFKQRTVSGSATLKFKPIAQPLAELRLDGIDLEVSAVTSSEKILGHQTTAEKIIITFDPPVPVGRTSSVTITYRAQPVKGLYFRTPELGYAAGDAHIWTQGEAIEARHWYPCYDAPNAKFTSEVTCRVPEGMVVLSNGKKMSEEKAGGLVTVRWLQDKPHVNYLISLVAGHFKKIEDRYRDIPLAFWTPASEINEAANSFRDTKDMMAFFERETGVPYPWAKYDQVCVQDFGWGGMENTTITTLNNNTLFTAATENIRSSQGLVAHELAHQWFGDFVTCKDWSHIWLNEGFASFYETLYDEHKNGRDQYLYRMHEGAKGIVAQVGDTKAIVHRKFKEPGEQFDYLAYGKGSWVLHMLRRQLGDELFRRCIQTYLQRHQYGSVVTEDLNAVLEELSGRSFDQFFDQWVYHARQPELDIEQSWDEKTRLARVTVRQTQAINENVFLFNFSLTVRFKSKAGVVERTVTVKEKAEDFYFALPQAPDVVRVDPHLAVLAKVNFKVPNTMLRAMLAERDDVLARLNAIDQLESKKDHESVALLKEALNDDPFYGVRMRAASALRAIHTDEALEALLASTGQPDARVRRQVVIEVGGFYREAAYELARKTLDSEKNPDIIASALGTLGAYPRPEVKTALLKYLNSQSFHNHLADAAIAAMRAQDDAAFIEPLRETLVRREAEFESRTLAQGLGALAWLARRQDNKDAVRELILRHANHSRKPVQLAALAALGTLEDTRALPVLEKFAAAAKESPERIAAEKSIAAINAARKAPAELGELRKELLDLQKDNRELRKEFDVLKKKLEATAAKTGKR